MPPPPAAEAGRSVGNAASASDVVRAASPRPRPRSRGPARGTPSSRRKAAAAPPARPRPEGCGCTPRPRPAGGLVFALGQVGYDLVSEARRDSIAQHMGGRARIPGTPPRCSATSKDNPWEAASIIWTLNADQTPLYAIAPAGPFAGRAYELLAEFLDDQLGGEVELVSIPGRLGGQARLFNGQVVPVVIPELRGIYSWSTGALVKAVVGEPPPDSAPAAAARGPRPQGSRPSAASSRRSTTSCATSASRPRSARSTTPPPTPSRSRRSSSRPSRSRWRSTPSRSSAARICRPDSDCWDVKIHFFYPSARCRRCARSSASPWMSATWSP